MKNIYLLFIVLALFSTIAKAQQTFNSLNVKDLGANRLLVTSTTQGSKPCPVMTETQRNALSALVGQCVYNSTSLQLNVYNGSIWKSAGGGGINAWVTANAYIVGDVVIESNKIYQCNTAHTSAASFATDIAKWTQLSNNVSDVTGILPLANGGTNKNLTANNGAVAYTDTDSVELLAPGTSGQILQTNGAGAPSFVNKSISGKSENNASITLEEIQVPNNLLTQTATNTFLNETGNTNILVNPSFEHSTTSSGWTTSSGTYSQETSVLVHGKKSLKIVLSSSTPVVTQDSTLYQAQLSGVQGVAYCRIKSDVTLTFATRNAGTTSTTNTVTVLNNNLWNLYKLPVILGATSNGVSIASASSQTGTVYVDDCYLGAADVKVDGAAITAWQSYTPTFTGFGTPTSVSFRWRQLGDSIQVEGTYVTGTVSAATASITLPNSYAIDTNKITIANTTSTAGQAVGQYRSTGANLFGHLVTATGTSTSLLYFANVISNATDSLVPSAGNASLASSRNMSINFMVPISGLQGAASSYSSTCGANCLDTFSAQGGITGIVSNESVNWINGDCTNANPSVCTFNTGIFTVSPNCTAIPNNANARVVTVTASSTVANVYQKDDTGAASRSEFTLSCQKQGADFAATRNIVGSFVDVMVTPGSSKPVHRQAKLTCTSSSAIVSQGIGSSWITSIGNLTTGQCAVTIPSGVFSSTPICVIARTGNATGTTSWATIETSATSIALHCNIGGAHCSAGETVNIFCDGVL